MNCVKIKLYFLLALLAVCPCSDSAATVEIPAQQKLMAIRAAQLDAFRLLGEQILGLEINSQTTVKDFVAESDAVAVSLDELIKAVVFGEPRFFDDGSVEIDGEVTVASIVETINRSVSRTRSQPKAKLREIDKAEVKIKTKEETIKVTGSGAVRLETKLPDPKSVPIIKAQFIGSTQSFAVPEIFKIAGPAERLKAKRAAEIDAYRKLFETVQGLQLSDETTVRDFVTESDTITGTFTGRLKGARTKSIRYMPDGVVEVQMQIDVPLLISDLTTICNESYKGRKWQGYRMERLKEYTDHKVITSLGLGTLSSAEKVSSAALGSEVGTISLE